MYSNFVDRIRQQQRDRIKIVELYYIVVLYIQTLDYLTLHFATRIRLNRRKYFLVY